MGYLHEGHGSLVDASVACSDLTVVSVFVNPLQFGAGEDLDSYPRDLEADLELCGSRGASLLFHPRVEEVYPEGPVQPAVPVADVARPLEGERRPGHFAGVAEVVARLLCAVGPCRAFFGQKDFQQLQVVRRMVVDLGLPVDVVGCPTSREHDGLARSSRNVYLTGAERAAAPVLHRALQAGAAAVAVPGWDRAEVEAMMADLLAGEPTASPEYAVVVDPDTLLPVDHPTSGRDLRVLVACRFGRARLIDNLGVVAG
jgi:pantoate--beta-alanine ligase